MGAQPFLSELQSSGFELFVDGDLLKITPASKLTDEQRHQIKSHKPEIIAALKSEQADRLEDFTELDHERAAITEYDGGLPRQEAEELAVRVVWKWTLETGESATEHNSAFTYEHAKKIIEQRHGRKVTHLEFISAMAEGIGFIPYTPELGELEQ